VKHSPQLVYGFLTKTNSDIMARQENHTKKTAKLPRRWGREKYGKREKRRREVIRGCKFSPQTCGRPRKARSKKRRPKVLV